MEIRLVCQEKTLWSGYTFYKTMQPHHEFREGRIKHLKKEVEELENSSYVDSPEELADCFLLLLHLSYLRDIDLLKEARKKMNINRAREWGEPDKDGVIREITSKWLQRNLA